MLPREESPTMNLYYLRKLLDQAMPNMEDTVRETLLLHQFVTELPIPISRPLRATGKTPELNSVLDPARLLMTMEKQCLKNAAVCDTTVVGMNCNKYKYKLRYYWNRSHS